jgi:hypothetical protein
MTRRFITSTTRHLSRSPKTQSQRSKNSPQISRDKRSREIRQQVGMAEARASVKRSMQTQSAQLAKRTVLGRATWVPV